MTVFRSIKKYIKYFIYKKYGYNLGGIKVKLANDYSDQKKLHTNINVQTIIDVGAHHGQTTQKYIKLFPKSTIHGFEPFPESFNIYKNNYRYDKRVIAENMAVSDSEGDVKFFVNKKSSTNSLLQPENADDIYFSDYNQFIANNACITVKTTTIDNYCTKNNIKSIDILKMDAQGAELSILRGAKNHLSGQKINLIYTEVEFINIYKNQPLFSDICTYLQNLGYDLFNIYNLYTASNGQLACGDAIFISKKFRKIYEKQNVL